MEQRLPIGTRGATFRGELCTLAPCSNFSRRGQLFPARSINAARSHHRVTKGRRESSKHRDVRIGNFVVEITDV